MIRHLLILSSFLLPSLGLYAQDDTLKEIIKEELSEMRATDQALRSQISYGTFDQQVIDSLNQLETDVVIAYMRQRPALPHAVQDSLWTLQRTLDYANIEKLQLLVRLYGWPDEASYGKELDPFVLLLHTPGALLEETTSLLLREVKAGRMPADRYAMFVDNMRMKHGQRQLYGTNMEFDYAQMKEMPATIDDLDASNAAREAIGLPPLAEGAYRLPGK